MVFRGRSNLEIARIRLEITPSQNGAGIDHLVFSTFYDFVKCNLTYFMNRVILNLVQDPIPFNKEAER